MTKGTLNIISFICIALLTVAVLGINFASGYPVNHRVFTGKVTDITETVSGKSHVKLVEVDNQDWYKVEDEWLLGKFNSRDLWGSLEESSTYQFESYGYRIGITSGYPKIVNATPIW